MTFATRLIAAVRSAKATAAVAVLVTAASMAMAPATTRAGSITYITSTGATTTGGSVDAKAVFTLGNGTIDITLTNLFQNPKSDAQLISALTFTVSGVGTNSASLSSITGNTSSIDTSSGTYSSPTAITSVSSTPWAATNTSGTLYLNDLTGGKPNDLIIGPDDKGYLDPSKGGKYTNANSSISQHNPVILGSATFVIDITGVTSSSHLSGVTFQFGTTSGSNQSVGVLSVPEPSTMAMGLSAMAMMAGVLIRRRRRTG